MAWKRSSWIALFLIFGLAAPVFADSKQIKKLKKSIAKAAAAENESELLGLMRDLADFESEDATEALYDVGFDHASTPAAYEEVKKLLGRRDGVLPFLLERYGKIKSKGDFRERVYITDVTASVPGPEAIAQLGGFLEDKSSFVQGASVDHLAASMTREAIGPLITLLEKLNKKRRDVLYHQVRDALWTLTGQDFDVIDDWIAWWEPNSRTFDPKASDHEGKTGVARKRRGEDPDFWGVPVESKNIVFVIDTSGSMKYIEKGDIPGLGRGDGSDSGSGSGGGQQTPEQQRLTQFWQRMTMAKRELTGVIKQLEKDALFNIVRFDTTTSKFLKKAAPATPGNKKKAFKWIEGIRHKGNTATLDALVDAFNADGRTNTIYFLSDGVPMKDGKNADAIRPILDKLFEMNRFRKIKIHTFGFSPVIFGLNGQPIPQLVEANKWLKELADATGGTFTIMKVDPKRTPDNPDGK